MTYEELATQSIASRIRRKKITEITGVDPSQWMVLGAIIDGKDQVISISKYLDVSMAFATNSINALEKKGLVKRQGFGADGRVRKVVYTGDEGWFDQAEQKVRAILDEA